MCCPNFGLYKKKYTIYDQPTHSLPPFSFAHLSLLSPPMCVENKFHKFNYCLIKEEMEARFE